METQFPVSKVSKESFKERDAKNAQTLPRLGKWWGRKPLLIVRATILGLLLPSTSDPVADRKVFLGLMTMDDDGMLRRLKAAIPARTAYEHSTTSERAQFFDVANARPKWKRATARGEQERLQKLSFLRMGYDERMALCFRPEEIDGPGPATWEIVNTHLCTSATSLAELVGELGLRRFGHTPKVGDGFSGGGSIPFEAARIGADAHGSDLNPVAALLTWASGNVIGAPSEIARAAEESARRVHAAFRRQVDEWGIERNEEGWVADAYLYCIEVKDPATGWRVPVAPSWVVGQGSKTIVRLIPRLETKDFDFEVAQGVSDEEIRRARDEGTGRNGIVCPVDSTGRWLAPNQRVATSFDQIRGRDGLRLWEKDDLAPRTDDTIRERLYCIRWVNPTTGERRFKAPNDKDQEREALILSLLLEKRSEWETQGYLPTRPIESGNETDRLAKERGWTHWHHLFNPRQLLLTGLYGELSNRLLTSPVEKAASLLTVGRLADKNSRLCRWDSSSANENTKQTFYNQALNPLGNYGCKTSLSMGTVALVDYPERQLAGTFTTSLADARTLDGLSDIWITDPGYAESVYYGELSEFFLCWYETRLLGLFPEWYADSKRALAVEGAGQDFRRAMVECYSHFANQMPDTGFQVVMFTHQDADVWADLALIMWASGLQVVAAWTVATETEAAGIRQGNYVQGTVLLVLKKRKTDLRGDLSDLYPELQAEVQSQMESMLALEDKEDPNFSDADFQLAAYAAALRVLTAYSAIDEIDIQRELARPRARGERSPLVALIERGVKIASDSLIPSGLDRSSWRNLAAEERFYLKGVEVESHGDYREGVYQEYARGYGVREYRPLLGSGIANQVRLKTPSEFRGSNLEGDGFGGSLLRKILFAVYKTAEVNNPRVGREYLRTELPDYWDRRQHLLSLLAYLAEKPRLESSMAHWEKDVDAARLLRGSIENDSV